MDNFNYLITQGDPLGLEKLNKNFGALFSPSDETVTFNPATIDDALGLIEMLPRFLPCNVTINVPAGTTSRDMDVIGFEGTRMLFINGATEVGQQTHNVMRMVIGRNNNDLIRITGITVKNTQNRAVFLYRSSAGIYLNRCNVIGGAGEGVGGFGCGDITLNSCSVSGRPVAIAASIANVVCVLLPFGEGNQTLYRAHGNGRINVVTEGTIQGTTYAISTNGGLVIDPQGRARGATTGLAGLFEPPIWHDVILQNGATIAIQTLRLRWVQMGNIVIITGRISLNTGSSIIIGNIPAQIRPNNTVTSITSVVGANRAGDRIVQLLNNGDINVHSGSGETNHREIVLIYTPNN